MFVSVSRATQLGFAVLGILANVMARVFLG